MWEVSFAWLPMMWFLNKGLRPGEHCPRWGLLLSPSYTHLAIFFPLHFCIFLYFFTSPSNYALSIISCYFLFCLLPHSVWPWNLAFPRSVPHEFPLHPTGSTRDKISLPLSALRHCFLGPNILYPVLTSSGSPTAQFWSSPPHIPTSDLIFRIEDGSNMSSKMVSVICQTCDTISQKTGISVAAPIDSVCSMWGRNWSFKNRFEEYLA
jgi:hypothetical protein